MTTNKISTKQVTDAGHCVVSNHSRHEGAPSMSRDPDGKVWVEVACGMGVHRFHLEPAEARQLAVDLKGFAEVAEQI